MKDVARKVSHALGAAKGAASKSYARAGFEVHERGGVLNTAIDGGLHVAGKAMKKTVKPAPQGQKLWNGFTGYKESGWGVLGVSAAGAGYAGYKLATNEKEIHKQLIQQGVSYQGTAPIMNSDGVANRGNAPTLGASGDVVLGLNAARRG